MRSGINGSGIFNFFFSFCEYGSDYVDEPHNDNEHDVCGDAANGLYDLAVEVLRVVHHCGECIVAVHDYQSNRCENFRECNNNAGEKYAADRLHRGKPVVENGYDNEQAPNN